MDISWPVGVVLGVFAFQVVLAVRSLVTNAAFLSAHPVLRDELDMAAFKRLAASDMWAALLYIATVVLAALVLVAGVGLGEMREWEAAVAVAGFAALLPLWVWVRHLERRVQAVPAATDELTDERDHVVNVWLKKPFPTWE